MLQPKALATFIEKVLRQKREAENDHAKAADRIAESRQQVVDEEQKIASP